MRRRRRALVEYFGTTDAGGERQTNEDSLLLGAGTDGNLFAVADGLGRHGAGKVASSMAIEVLARLEPRESLEEGIRRANREIFMAHGNGHTMGMATTVVALRFFGEEEELFAEVAHVGDSRAYLLRGQWLLPLTEDHSLVSELEKRGAISSAQAAEHPRRNVITRALGIAEEVRVDRSSFWVRPGDRALLCSDGLTDMVPEPQICRMLRDTSHDVETAARGLATAAREAGSVDDITAVIVDVKGEWPGQNRASELGAGPRSCP